MLPVRKVLLEVSRLSSFRQDLNRSRCWVPLLRNKFFSLLEGFLSFFGIGIFSLPDKDLVRSSSVNQETIAWLEAGLRKGSSALLGDLGNLISPYLVHIDSYLHRSTSIGNMKERSWASMKFDWSHIIASSFCDVIRSITENFEHCFRNGIFVIDIINDSDFDTARFLSSSNFICKSASLKIIFFVKKDN